MLLTILQHTPLWVWAILFTLVGLGLMQSVARSVSLRRVVLLPLAMTALSIHGTFHTFPPAAWSWVSWLGAAMVPATWFGSADLPAGVRFDAPHRTFHMPGRWEPLMLMLTIFLTRYGVGVLLGMQPALTRDPAVAAIVSSIYGALSGVFIGRLVRLLRAARDGAPPAPPAATVAWG